MKITNETSHQYISIYQKENRISKIPYSNCKMFVCLIKENGLEFIVGGQNNDKILTVENKFPAGEYLIYIDISWAQQNYNIFTLSKEKKNVIIKFENNYNQLTIK
jgi:hypothetical protein